MTLRDLIQSLLEGELDDEVVVRPCGLEGLAPGAITGSISFEAKDGEERGQTIVYAAIPDATVHVAVWEDDGAPNAQAYTTLAGAERDYPQATIVASTVQA